MDVSAPRFPRIAAASPSWRQHPRDQQRRRSTDWEIKVEAAATPVGPAPAFMAHVLGQSGVKTNPTGAAAYAEAKRIRMACGVCADERA